MQTGNNGASFLDALRMQRDHELVHADGELARRNAVVPVQIYDWKGAHNVNCMYRRISYLKQICMHAFDLCQQ